MNVASRYNAGPPLQVFYAVFLQGGPRLRQIGPFGSRRFTKIMRAVLTVQPVCEVRLYLNLYKTICSGSNNQN